MTETEIKPGRYRHYKGKDYQVIGVGRDEETLKQMVVYRALYDTNDFGKKPIWIRPKNVFLETVEVDEKEVPRFEFIGPGEDVRSTKMMCPNCHDMINVDSTRRHRDGTERVYWECEECNLSIMIRDKENIK